MRREIRISSILNGMSPSGSIAGEGQYWTGSAIDPTLQANNYDDYGFIQPVLHTKFSSTEITGVPMFFVKNPKTENTYLYASDGKVHTVSSALAMGTALNGGSALTSAAGNGAAYYDNYVYFATNTGVTRYGPLNGSPSLDQTYWTTTLSKTALVDTTYPSVNGIEMPNHPMFVSEQWGRLYFGDVVGNAGVIHYIKTTKTTVEGDTNNGSAYNALDLPYGYYPTAIAEHNNYLIIACIDGTGTTISQRKAKLILWDQSSDTYTQIIEVDDPLITALKVVNGSLFIFSGDATTQRAQVRRYAGGFNTQIFSTYNGYPALCGAVDSRKDRLIFGTLMDSRNAQGIPMVLALGTEDGRLVPARALHSIAALPGSGSVSAVSYVLPGKPPVAGVSGGLYKNDQSVTIAAAGNTAQVDLTSMRYKIGKPFQVVGYSFGLGTKSSTYTIQPTIITDNRNVFDGAVVNTTNYPAGTNRVKYNFNVDSPDGLPMGVNDLMFELEWTGGTAEAILLPIIIDVDVLEDGDYA